MDLEIAAPRPVKLWKLLPDLLYITSGIVFILQLVLHLAVIARMVIMNPVFSFLYMHMQYHVEHHIFPNVPFHALRRLHRAVRDQMPVPYRGLWGAYWEIIPTLLRQRHDVDYYVRRELPGAV